MLKQAQMQLFKEFNRKLTKVHKYTHNNASKATSPTIRKLRQVEEGTV